MTTRGNTDRVVPSHKSVADVLLSDGLQTSMTATSTAQEVKVGSLALQHRKMVFIYNTSKLNSVYWSYSSSVTGSSNGFPISSESFAEIKAGKGCPIYIVSDSGSITVIVAEAG